MLAQALIELLHEIGRNKAQGPDDAVYVDVPHEFDPGFAVPIEPGAVQRQKQVRGVQLGDVAGERYDHHHRREGVHVVVRNDDGGSEVIGFRVSSGREVGEDDVATPEEHYQLSSVLGLSPSAMPASKSGSGSAS